MRCLPPEWRCDGLSDCADDSDERDCDLDLGSDYLNDAAVAESTNHEREDCFTCHDTGACVSRGFVCDGERDCYDASDEMFCGSQTIDARAPLACAAKRNWFHCDSHFRCVHEDKVCDDVSDCLDGSDEKYCVGGRLLVSKEREMRRRHRRLRHEIRTMTS